MPLLACLSLSLLLLHKLFAWSWNMAESTGSWERQVVFELRCSYSGNTTGGNLLSGGGKGVETHEDVLKELHFFILFFFFILKVMNSQMVWYTFKRHVGSVLEPANKSWMGKWSAITEIKITGGGNMSTPPGQKSKMITSFPLLFIILLGKWDGCGTITDMEKC